MHHKPVADRLGVPRHQLPADWRQRGGGGATPTPPPPGREVTGCGLGVIALIAVAACIGGAILYNLTIGS